MSVCVARCFFFTVPLLFGWRKKNRMQPIKFVRLVIVVTNSRRLMYYKFFVFVLGLWQFFCAFGFYCRKRIIICLALRLSIIVWSVCQTLEFSVCQPENTRANHIAEISFYSSFQSNQPNTPPKPEYSCDILSACLKCGLIHSRCWCCHRKWVKCEENEDRTFPFVFVS